MTGAVRSGDQYRDARSTQLEELMQTVVAGDAAAFARIYDLTAAQVFGVIVRVVKNRALAEEVLQDVYLHVWQNASRFVAARGTVGAWICIIAHRRAVDCVRATQSSRERDWREGTRLARDNVVNPHESIDSQEERRYLCEALAQLSHEHRRYLDLAYGAGLSQAEIAAHTGVPLGTVKSRMRRALTLLRGNLANNPVFIA
ncbi:sigma-70 family RNA polymerase sigma factor [Microbacterium sp. JC 701]|uniref:sigma-70 family RNA polymerase sigma factor n=1 Tax=Microbacterium sp. JC 701 TaxID=2897389 RepID=UPI001E2EC330|nr:sigma-70 family RNA polymerase sigma factor [Microbacterium sp. JC 701]MCD2170346.1 sigma-70 family RNA polymerase sigma factor [Microbacterium sp. JC 701]